MKTNTSTNRAQTVAAHAPGIVRKHFLTVRDIRLGREVRPCRQLDKPLWYARLWCPVVGYMGNVYLNARCFGSREECQDALERAALAQAKPTH